jgi:hypothetical protein
MSNEDFVLATKERVDFLAFNLLDLVSAADLLLDVLLLLLDASDTYDDGNSLVIR